MTERWKPVVGYEGRYEVSDLGRVNSLARGLLALTDGGTGYQVVTLLYDGVAKQFRVHRLVLHAFVGPAPDGYVGCHSDGNRKNNRLANLRWDSQKENVADTRRHGHTLAGEKNHKAILSADQVQRIRDRIAAGDRGPAIYKEVGISRQLFYRIKKNLIWRHL